MIAPYFARLPTGIKMLIILSAALLPLGLIALFASMESAKDNRLARQAETQLMASNSARMLSLEIERTSGNLSRLFASPQIAPMECPALLRQISATHPGHYALFDRQGKAICAQDGFRGRSTNKPAAGIGTEVRLIQGQELLRTSLIVAGGEAIAVGELDQAALMRLAQLRGSVNYALDLRQGDARIALADTITAAPPLGERLAVVAPVAGGQLLLDLRVNAAPISAIEVLMVLLPLLMWLAAAVIGWLVVDRLLVRPLAQMQQAIQAHTPGETPLVIPQLATPSQEIRGLATAFLDATRQLRAHEAELEQGLARQTRLTREVHHRVKNNLQVVSSLINLHSRGASSPDVANAYAAIQRRVDALAVVHRNHYAELEENRGVGLRALIGELASNLRATAPPEASRTAIDLELIVASASQDVAVPVAFLITEMVEMVMACDPGGGIVIRLGPGPAPDRARLTLTATGLAATACSNHPNFDRFRRILEGLARQLRAPLDHDEAAGSYTIEIAILP